MAPKASKAGDGRISYSSRVVGRAHRGSVYLLPVRGEKCSLEEGLALLRTFQARSFQGDLALHTKDMENQ